MPRLQGPRSALLAACASPYARLVIERLEGFIAERWAELVLLDERAAQFDPPLPRPPFTEDETAGFMRGIDAGLFKITAVTTKVGIPEMAYECEFCDIRQYLFADGAKTGQRTFSREFVPQWAAACDLISEMDGRSRTCSSSPTTAGGLTSSSSIATGMTPNADP